MKRSYQGKEKNISIKKQKIEDEDYLFQEAVDESRLWKSYKSTYSLTLSLYEKYPFLTLYLPAYNNPITSFFHLNQFIDWEMFLSDENPNLVEIVFQKETYVIHFKISMKDGCLDGKTTVIFKHNDHRSLLFATFSNGFPVGEAVYKLFFYNYSSLLMEFYLIRFTEEGFPHSVHHILDDKIDKEEIFLSDIFKYNREKGYISYFTRGEWRKNVIDYKSGDEIIPLCFSRIFLEKYSLYLIIYHSSNTFHHIEIKNIINEILVLIFFNNLPYTEENIQTLLKITETSLRENDLPSITKNIDSKLINVSYTYLSNEKIYVEYDTETLQSVVMSPERMFANCIDYLIPDFSLLHS